LPGLGQPLQVPGLEQPVPVQSWQPVRELEQPRHLKNYKPLSTRKLI
jgi:hypothetical protein